MARALGEEDDLAWARAMLEHGTCHGREMDIYRRTGAAKAVVRALANELLGEIEREPLE